MPFLLTARAWAQAPLVSSPAPERTVRVGLRQGVAQLRVTCPAKLVLLDAAGAPLLEGALALSVSRRADPPGLRLQVPAADAAPEVDLPVPLAPLTLRAADGASPLDAGFAKTRGSLLLLPGASGFSVIAILPLDDYVRGVLPAEMPASAPIEALKAQAIAIRTYTLACLGSHRAEGFDLCPTTHCQVYGGPGAERETTDRAVAETRGQVLLYQGRPITAFYHANCGGATGSPPGVGEPPPYLRGGPDTEPGLGADLTTGPGMLALAAGAPDVFCAGARAFSWQIERSREELAAMFARTLPLLLRKRVELGDLTGLSIGECTSSGRAATLIIKGTAGTSTVRGDSIRRLFRPALASTRFVIRPIWDGDKQEGPPARYRLIGFGWGHGAGLCQDGAIGMAARGHTAAEILAHYYPGTELGAAP